MKQRYDFSSGKPLKPGRWFRDGKSVDECLARVRKADEEDIAELKACLAYEQARMIRKPGRAVLPRRPQLIAAIQAKLESLEYAEL